ncbi:MAG TPA: hypothetical protein DCP32_03665 [Anaerolineaceae bacterium]|nr:hypothetical protein [Anaerolineaceae bacterium]HBA90448.1 hypothetical protein [Anaerolineaceae bacterium]
MSTEKLVKSLGKYMERRTFLKGLGVGTIAALSALLGMPKNVSATVSYKCCNLCYSPTSPCSSQSCPYAWCWFCNYAPESRDYKCVNVIILVLPVTDLALVSPAHMLISGEHSPRRNC